MNKVFRLSLVIIFVVGSLLAVPVKPAYAANLPAEINKQFTPLQIDAGGVSIMRVTIFNPNIFQLTNASWVDNLVSVQPGLFIANPPGVVNTCGGTVNATAGATTLSLSGGTVAPQVGSTPGECYVEVNVSSRTAGNLINNIPANNLTAQGNDNGTTVNITNTTPANATITVIAVTPPSLSKVFVPSTVFVGQTSQLTIRINNNDADTNLTGATYTDNLPAGLQIATPNGLTLTNCGPGSATAAAGTSTITLTNATITPANDCLVQVNVVGVAGAYLIANGTANTIPAGPSNPGSLQTTQGVTNGSPAQAEITVQPVGITKAFAPGNVDAGDTTSLTITLQNPTGTAYTPVGITDNLTTMGTGYTVAGAPTANTCGGTVTAAIGGTSIALTGGTIPASATPPTPNTCVITIPVQTPLTSAGGTVTNTIPANTLTGPSGLTNLTPATANLTINRALTGTKAYAPATIPLGGTSTVTITLNNASSTILTGVNFTDTLNANLTVSGTPASPQCGGIITNTAGTVTLTGGTIPANGNCTIVFTVTSNTASPAGGYDNTLPANSITNAQGVGHAGISTNPDLVVVNATNLPVGLNKTFQTDPIAPGQATRLRITVTAPADTSISGINISDNLPAGMVISAFPPAPVPTETCPGGTLTAVAGTNVITFTNTAADVLNAGTNCNIDVRVTSNAPNTYTNTLPASTITTIEGRTNLNPVSAILRVTSLTMSKAFYPNTVQTGGRSTLTITLNNSTASPLINVALNDPLPGTVANGVRVATVPNVVNTCGGTVTAAAGAANIILTNGTIPAQVGSIPGLCTISVDVVGTDSTPATASTQTNTIPVNNVTATVQSTGTSITPFAQAQATLNIQSLTMGIVKGFNPVLVYGGAYSTMSVQLINPNLAADLTGITFTDDMTLLGTGMQLANPVAFDVGTCGGALSGNPGDTSFTFSGGILPANSTCTLTLRVVMNVNGNLTNRIPAGAVTTFNGVSNPDPTEASLTNLPGVSINKTFNPSQVLTNQPSVLTITIANTSNVPVVNMGVADTLPGNLPDGLEVANPANASTDCGGTLTATPGAQAVQLSGGGLSALGNPGASCTITVSVISNRPGVYINTIPPGALTANGGVTNNNPASATLTVTSNYSLGNRVWYDTNNNSAIDGSEQGISGVRVELYQDNGTNPGVFDAGDTFVGFATTDASGYYRFDNLTAGDYVVAIPADNFRNVGGGDTVAGDPLAGYWSSGTSINAAGVASDSTANDADTTPTDSDDNGLSTISSNQVTFVAAAAVTLGPGASEPLNEADLSATGQGTFDAYANMTVDFGFYRQSLGNLVYIDVNEDGTFNTGETPISGATVQLFSSNGTEINVGPDGILGTSDDAPGGVTTGAGGTYLFSGLPQGDYIVRVTPPTGFASTVDTFSPADSTSPNSNIDNNDNGVGTGTGQVSSNPVTLTPGSTGAANNNTVNNANGTTSNPTVDFGFTTSNYSLGNRVWYDTNNNSTIDGSEQGVSGVRVELYQDNGTNPGVFDAGDTFVGFATTDASGYYRFDNLTAGDYVVTIPADNFRNVGGGDTVAGDPLAGYWSSGTSINAAGVASDSTANDADTTPTDSDDNGLSTISGNQVTFVAAAAVTLGPGASEPLNEADLSATGQGSTDSHANMTVDFGFYRQSLGNLVFADSNGNGTFDAGDSPLPGATVQLFSSNGTEINVGPDGILGTSDDAPGGVTTGAGGTYLFSGLPQGDYIVSVTPPTGYASTVDSASPVDTTNPNTNTDNNDNGVGTGTGQVSSNPVTLTPGSAGAANNNTVNNANGTTSNPTVDFGFIGSGSLVSVGSTVFADINGNGIQDAGEPGINGVLIALYLSSQTPGVNPPVTSVTTDANGDYYFGGLQPGSYILYIPTPPASAPLSSSLGVTDTNDNGEDGDDNGTQTASGQPVISPIINLALGGETANEPFQGGSQDNADDTNGDMTVDFGFVPTNALVADPAIAKRGDPNQASIGERVVFTLTVTNSGNAPASNVVVTDPLPPIFDVVSVTAVNQTGANVGTASFTPGPAPYTVTVTIPTVDVTDVITITITTTVNGRGNPPINNTARLATTSQTDRLVNNASTATITIVDATSLVLPATGFAPKVSTMLGSQPQNKQYKATTVVLEIPALGVKVPIVGVPKVNGTWDVSWLANQAGWLEGSAFPSWNGNSVLTSHVYNANGLPGPFVNLNKLKYGDKIIIHAYGQKYTFEVQANTIVSPNNTSALKHMDRSWLTLITCKEYDQKTNSYKKRVVVGAVLVTVEADK